MDKPQTSQWVTAAELANYVVCPEAWRLKYVGTSKKPSADRAEASKQLRQEWVERQDLSAKLRSYARVAYLLLFALAIIVFLLETKRVGIFGALKSDPRLGASGEIPAEITLLLLTLGLIIFMWDLFERRSAKIRKSGGLSESSEAISLKGSSQLPGREFRSEALGLSSKPDALIKEDHSIIPVDIHPLTNKIRDRHVVVMLAHLRLIEESEGSAPTHGLLLMGKGQRPVNIKNTPEKQRWLSTLIDEMRSIMEGVPAVPAPAIFKCKHCDFREICTHSAYTPGAANSSTEENDQEDQP